MDNTFENRLQAIEYELSQIAESEYLNELTKKFNNELDVDVIVNIIPSKAISFKTHSLLSAILNRLELSQKDRLDLEKYIVFGGGNNIEYIKSTLADWVKWKDKILNILEGAPEEFDSLIEIFNYIEQHINDSIQPNEIDWNATEEDRGFIRNKPVYDTINKTLSVSDFTYDENEEVWVHERDYSTDYFALKAFSNSEDGSILSSKLYIVDSDNKTANFNIYNAEWAIIGGDVFLNITDDYKLLLKITAFDEYDLEHILELIRYRECYNDEVNVKQLSDMYIPDTIARKTELTNLSRNLQAQIRSLENRITALEDNVYNLNIGIGTWEG